MFQVPSFSPTLFPMSLHVCDCLPLAPPICDLNRRGQSPSPPHTPPDTPFVTEESSVCLSLRSLVTIQDLALRPFPPPGKRHPLPFFPNLFSITFLFLLGSPGAPPFSPPSDSFRLQYCTFPSLPLSVHRFLSLACQCFFSFFKRPLALAMDTKHTGCPSVGSQHVTFSIRKIQGLFFQCAPSFFSCGPTPGRGISSEIVRKA